MPFLGSAHLEARSSQPLSFPGGWSSLGATRGVLHILPFSSGLIRAPSGGMGSFSIAAGSLF